TLLQLQLQHIKFFFSHDTKIVVVLCTIALQKYNETTTTTTGISTNAYRKTSFSFVFRSLIRIFEYVENTFA
ncbi:MAG: hypothetical protein IKQ37_06390, partial [Bacteroidaceae bacterium]|nr:hypothetical protein [Bacteroidaceae bacterium]